jgi:ABC-2 type transport system permease protein
MGTPIGNGGVLAVAWCVGIGLFGYLWARRLFNRDPSRRSHSPGCNVLVLKS